MRRLLVFLVIPVGLAYGGSNVPTPSHPGAPQGAATAGKTVDQTASPELVGQLVSDLAITPAQAEGAAGALFGVAKTKLSAADFAKVAGAVPNMQGLLKAAPASGAKTSAADLVAGASGAAALGGAASAAGALSKLGLKPETILKLTPTLVKAVQSKGGAEVGALLAGALK